MPSWRSLLVSLLAAACASSSLGRRPALGVPIAAGVHVEDHLETWNIPARNASGVYNALRFGIPQAGGFGHAGYLQWNLRWTYRPIVDSSGCRVAEADVYLRTTLTLPVWNPPPQVAAMVVSEWDRFLHAVEVHEQGHRLIAVTAARRIREAIMGVAAPSCAVLPSLVKIATAPLLDELRRTEEQYDTETHHGATQGVAFRP